MAPKKKGKGKKSSEPVLSGPEAEAEMERKLALAEESKQRALELLRVELLGTTTQQVEALAAKEKEERIALLRRQSARRLLNAGLAHGWAAWIEVRLTGDPL